MSNYSADAPQGGRMTDNTPTPGRTEPLYDDSPQITRINLDTRQGTLEIEAIIPNVAMLAAECTKLLDAHNAKNYVQFDMIPSLVSGNPGYRVTVQRADGKSPAQRVNEMETALAAKDARIAELEAQLAERGGWEPVPDGKYCNESPDGSADWCIKITDNGDSIWQWSSSDDEWTEIGSLSFWGFVLCRRVQREDENNG